MNEGENSSTDDLSAMLGNPSLVRFSFRHHVMVNRGYTPLTVYRGARLRFDKVTVEPRILSQHVRTIATHALKDESVDATVLNILS